MLFLFLLIVVPIVLYEIYNSQTHIRCDAELLREDARVISVDTKEVGSKTTRKYRTTVVFSDGFEYISHMTHRDDGFMHYTIFITQGMKDSIVADAKVAHLERLRKYQKKKGIPITNTINNARNDFIEYSKPIPTIKIKPEDISVSSDGTTWTCPICKRRNVSASNKCWNCSSIKEQ